MVAEASDDGADGLEFLTTGMDECLRRELQMKQISLLIKKL
jgi:hypothetical protein